MINHSIKVASGKIIPHEGIFDRHDATLNALHMSSTFLEQFVGQCQPKHAVHLCYPIQTGNLAPRQLVRDSNLFFAV